MRSFRLPRSPGHSVPGRSLDPAALPALLRATYLSASPSHRRNAILFATTPTAIPIAPLHKARTSRS